MALTAFIALWLMSGGICAYRWCQPPITWFDVMVIFCGALMGFVMVFLYVVIKLVEAKFWRKPVWPKRET